MLHGLHAYEVGIPNRGREGLFEDHVNAARGAGLDDFQMPAVVHKCPDEGGLGLLQHLRIVAEELLGAPFASLFDEFRLRFGNPHQAGGFAFDHLVDVAPNVGVPQTNDGDSGGLGSGSQGNKQQGK